MAKDANGATPLMIATYLNNLSIVKTIINSLGLDADTTIDDTDDKEGGGGGEKLSKSKTKKKRRNVSAILNATDSGGRTAYYFACLPDITKEGAEARKIHDILASLSSSENGGLDLELSDDEGLTPEKAGEDAARRRVEKETKKRAAEEAASGQPRIVGM
jgi:ankyrin repeat protein